VSFEAGEPPELVIEILPTRRGNVERTEKLDDYARAGIGEYWIVNPFERGVEVYVLRQGEYTLRETAQQGTLSPQAFPGVAIDLKEVWAALG
jgi:Uma2 family endonuclease